MKYAFAVLTLTLAPKAFATKNNIKIIYGQDDRLDLRDVTDARILEVAESTAALIPQYVLEAYQSPSFSILSDLLTLEGKHGICSTERFAKQPALAGCSGFLVGEKTLVTAGHCVDQFMGCGEKVWVFDYKLDTPGVDDVTIDPSTVYKCARVVTSVLNPKTKMDYAVIELDRVVEGRQPLKIRKSGKPRLNTPLIVIGHPSGLPTKVAGGAKIMLRKTNYFGANLDTYGGNSGSAVFNAKTLEVEGILVRGDEDYVPTGDGCRVSNVRSKSRGSEHVTRITKVPGI